MLFDARDIPAHTQLDCDVVIVGGGAAGITLARELSDTPLDVMLLEGGGWRHENATQALYKGDVVNPAQHGPLDKYRHRGIGGTSTLWGGRCAPFDDIDFERRPHVPHSGWPLGRSDLDACYERAHAYCHAGRYDYDAATLPHGRLPMIPGLVSDEVLQDRLWRFSLPTNFARLFMPDLKQSGNVRVGLHANCLSIGLGAEGKHARELRVASLRGNVFTVRARQVVLAAGGLETTRLLLASRDVCPAGIGNDHDLVGRFYTSHITGELGEAVFTPKGGPIIWDYERSYDGVYCRRTLAIHPRVQRREGLLNFRCSLSHPPIADPSHRNGILSAAYLVKRFLINRIPPEYSKDMAGHMTPYRNVPAHLLNLLRGAPALLPFAAKWIGARVLAERKLPSVSLPNRENVYSLHFDAEQSPNPDSRVMLTDDRDALGVPRLRVDWRHSPLDVDSVLRCFQIVKRDLTRCGVASFRLDEADFPARVVAQLGVGSHHIGTTRMADDPAHGVVDADCRVHGVDNLFIASSSVFPTASFANPTLTIVAVAVRVADQLRRLNGIGLKPADTMEPRAVPAAANDDRKVA